MVGRQLHRRLGPPFERDRAQRRLHRIQIALAASERRPDDAPRFGGLFRRD